MHELKFADCDPITSDGDFLCLQENQRRALRQFLLFGGVVQGGEIQIGADVYGEGDELENGFPRRISYLTTATVWDANKTAGQQLWVVSRQMGYAYHEHIDLLENYFSRFKSSIDWELPVDVLTEQEKMHLAIFRALIMRALVIIIDGVTPKATLLEMLKSELGEFGVRFLQVREVN